MSVKKQIRELLASGEKLYQNQTVGRFLRTVKFSEVKKEDCVSEFNQLVTQYEGEPSFEKKEQ